MLIHIFAAVLILALINVLAYSRDGRVRKFRHRNRTLTAGSTIVTTAGEDT